MTEAVVNPGYDLRTLITVAVVIPILTFTAIGVARLLGRGLRRWSRFTARSVRVAVIAAPIVVEAVNATMGPRFDQLEVKFDDMAEENHRAHSEVGRVLARHEGRLDSIDDRLKLLESRRRDDPQED